MSILTEVKDQVGYITMNRPEAFNSMTLEMSAAIQQQLKDWNASEDIRAVVLTGAGKAFCAGQDLKEATGDDAPTMEYLVINSFNTIVTLLQAMKKPVLAMVNGVAAGAGANIALACDIILASEKASFIQAFSKIGLIPDSGGTFYLPKTIGYHKAMSLMLLGDKLTASQAKEAGFVYEVYDMDNWEDGSHAVAKKLAAMPTLALAHTKRLLQESYGNSFQEQLDVELKSQIICGDSEDKKEGMAAFLEKRKPVFKGK